MRAHMHICAHICVYAGECAYMLAYMHSWCPEWYGKESPRLQAFLTHSAIKGGHDHDAITRLLRVPRRPVRRPASSRGSLG